MQGVEHLVVSAFVSCPPPPALDIRQYLFNPECSFRIAGGSCKDLWEEGIPACERRPLLFQPKDVSNVNCHNLFLSEEAMSEHGVPICIHVRYSRIFCVERAYGRPIRHLPFSIIVLWTPVCDYMSLVHRYRVIGQRSGTFFLFTLNEDCMGGSQSSPPQCAHLGAYLVVKGVVQDLEKEKSPKQCLYCLCLVLQG